MEGKDGKEQGPNEHGQNIEHPMKYRNQSEQSISNESIKTVGKITKNYCKEGAIRTSTYRNCARPLLPRTSYIVRLRHIGPSRNFQTRWVHQGRVHTTGPWTALFIIKDIIKEPKVKRKDKGGKILRKPMRFLLCCVSSLSKLPVQKWLSWNYLVFKFYI